ncbi:hypothetical protein [Neisseria sp. Ec49-e6-T10]|uniref:hypothetical protein n=1 Tax=Neisseria sp. Ec49-e6-T10 TaxID=3140744 RepID=UPI003EBC61E1
MRVESIIFVVVCVGAVVVILLGSLALLKMFYTKVPQGTALIKNGLFLSQPKVTFTGSFVFPVIHIKEFMKISLVTLQVDRRGKDGLICKDNLRADITVAFYLRVNETREDVLKVAKSIGVNRASDHNAMDELFNAKFSEALKTVGKQFNFEQLFDERQNFRDRIVQIIGEDLNGYALEDVAIDYLEQTPMELLDKNKIQDAEGIRKITELTARESVATNELNRNAELAIQKKDVEAKEASLALERQQATAEAQQKREIESTQAREEAETQMVVEQQRLKAEEARIATQEQIDVRTQNQQREVEVAEQNRQRAVVVEIEKVTRAKELEVVAREREVELQRIDKEKALEGERKEIANVIRERVVVEKTVAQEEERIKDVRVVSEAERLKQVAILEAEAQAEQELVRQVKQAEADEERSKHKAVEINTLAQAELEAAAKQAEAKIRMAQGVEAERAAPGLADARVLEVTAAAKEKDGLANARIQAELLIAEAKGEQEKGLAEARVIEAKADAKEKDGLAEAKMLQEKLSAQARGEEQIGLTKARITKEQGVAEAQFLLDRLNAESEGLAKKFAAMNSLSDNTRAHEEFRMQLEKDFDQALAAISANKEIAKEQAEVLAAALSKAKVELVGGGGDYFNAFAKSLSIGKGIEGVVGKSPVVQDLIARLLGGDKGSNGNIGDLFSNSKE